jgi:hypothetical protein
MDFLPFSRLFSSPMEKNVQSLFETVTKLGVIKHVDASQG